MQDMGEGRQTGKVKASGAKKDSMCVRMCARVCVRVCVCVHVFPRTTIPCVCMHVFVKKRKKWKKI